MQIHLHVDTGRTGTEERGVAQKFPDDRPFKHRRHFPPLTHFTHLLTHSSILYLTG